MNKNAVSECDRPNKSLHQNLIELSYEPESEHMPVLGTITQADERLSLSGKKMLHHLLYLCDSQPPWSYPKKIPKEKSLSKSDKESDPDKINNTLHREYQTDKTIEIRNGKPSS